MNNNEGDRHVPAFFEECINNGTFRNIQKIGKNNYAFPDQPSVCGISGYRESAKGNFFYLIGWPVFTDGPMPDGFEHISIPANKWAIFKTEIYPDGSDDIEIIQRLWRRIYREWLPTSGYDIVEAPTIELDYYDNPKECHAEIWIPVVRSTALPA
jgi:AraC family transcriptional regulator